MIRKHVYFKGRVQGVFFRKNTKEKARKEGVRGWVRNLRDGRVEAVFEGAEDRVKEVIRWCRNEQPHAKVTDVEIIDEEFTNEFKGFDIRR